MMVKFIVFFALALPLHIAAQGCMQNDNNQCRSNGDCCSGNCWKGNANWATGVCKRRDGDGNNGNNGNNGGGGSGLVTREQFNKAVTSSGYPTPRPGQYQGFMNGLSKGQISTKREAAMALAQFMHESDGLRAKEEYECMNTKCPNSYSNSRDKCEVPGKYYYGRGYIQLSWCYNYRDAGKGLNLGDKLLKNPDLVASDEQLAWDTAFWFWRDRVRNGQYGAQVQAGQFGYSTRAINGKEECTGSNLKKSQNRFALYRNVFSAFGFEGQPDERGCY